MTVNTFDPQDFYSCPGVMTNPGEYSTLFTNLPADLSALCRVVQGMLLHVFWAERYGRKISDEEQQTLNLRSIKEKLARLRSIDDSPLTEVRSLEKRQIGNCRDFSLMLCSILRLQGVPARARCGFGAYFLPGHFEDHWVCEYWNSIQNRWMLVDAQLDDLQCQVLSISFDPLDVPRDQFIVAGKAWQMCSKGMADPQQFGIFDMHGLWFIWGDMIRDFLALNKVEILPWDWWENSYFHQLADHAPTEDEAALCERIAALTLSGDETFTEIRNTYESDIRWHIPDEWVK